MNLDYCRSTVTDTMSLTNDFTINYNPPQSAKIRFRLWAFTKKVCCKCLISMSRGIFTDKSLFRLASACQTFQPRRRKVIRYLVLRPNNINYMYLSYQKLKQNSWSYQILIYFITILQYLHLKYWYTTYLDYDTFGCNKFQQLIGLTLVPRD